MQCCLSDPSLASSHTPQDQEIGTEVGSGAAALGGQILHVKQRCVARVAEMVVFVAEL
jgi:hypothetical protein